ncbi:MAG: 6-phosphogluconolactonase, partial [Dactylosporangium sp.]|nr:6-phosphogluconolactonase [Dactylosporangium sp.]NNJ60742.1 6-phosphogluconolactonase [Dactylosporangium sp.]
AAGSGTPPAFVVLLLGIGEDGHIASVFPGVPLDCPDGPVSAVRNSPKPPPVRLTLTPATINTASEIWLVASGAGKAAAVRSASLDGGASGVPAAGVRAATRTVWLLDRAAAGPA